MERRKLIDALLRSDEDAWRLFIRQYGPLIYSIVARFPEIRNERDDAFQEVCIAVHRSLGSLRDPDKLTSWLFGIAWRHAVARLGRHSRQRTVPLSEHAGDLAAPDRQPDQEYELLQDIAVLHDLIGALRPRCRSVLGALYLEEPPLSYEQLAGREGIPLGSIGPTRARCLEKLRLLWEQALDPAPEKVSMGASPRTTGSRDEAVMRERTP